MCSEGIGIFHILLFAAWMRELEYFEYSRKCFGSSSKHLDKKTSWSVHYSEADEAFNSYFTENICKLTEPRLKETWNWKLQANGHALLAKSGEKRGGRGKRKLKISTISYATRKMSVVTFHCFHKLKQQRQSFNH